MFICLCLLCLLCVNSKCWVVSAYVLLCFVSLSVYGFCSVLLTCCVVYVSGLLCYVSLSMFLVSVMCCCRLVLFLLLCCTESFMCLWCLLPVCGVSVLVAAVSALFGVVSLCKFIFLFCVVSVLAVSVSSMF